MLDLDQTIVVTALDCIGAPPSAIRRRIVIATAYL